MTISAECRLGPYEILSPLGAGGMGDAMGEGPAVGATVAVKMLPEHLSASPGTTGASSRRPRRFRSSRPFATLLPHRAITESTGQRENDPL